MATQAMGWPRHVVAADVVAAVLCSKPLTLPCGVRRGLSEVALSKLGKDERKAAVATALAALHKWVVFLLAVGCVGAAGMSGGHGVALDASRRLLGCRGGLVWVTAPMWLGSSAHAQVGSMVASLPAEAGGAEAGGGSPAAAAGA